MNAKWNLFILKKHKNLHHQPQWHRSVGGTGQFQMSSPSVAQAKEKWTKNTICEATVHVAIFILIYLFCQVLDFYQREVIRVDPDNAEVWVVFVVLGNML